MTEQETINMARNGYGYFTAGNIQALMNDFADDIAWSTPEADGVPFAGSYSGKQEVADYFRKLGDAMRITRFEVRDIIAQEDKAAVSGMLAGEAVPTGRPIEFEWVHVLTYSNGKLQRCQQFYDTAAAEDAFASMPAASGASQTTQPLH